MIPDDLLLELQIETLYRVGNDGRLLCVNEPGSPPAPRLFLGRTRRRNVVRYRHDLPDELVRALDLIVGREPLGATLSGEPPVTYQAIRAVLGAHDPIRDEWRGPAFRFPDDGGDQVVDPSIRVVGLGEESAALLGPDFAPHLVRELEVQPVVAAVVDGTAVAVCHSARRSARAAEAGVATLPGFRGRGYGAAVVTGWARAVRQLGLVPLYSTSWDNTASRRLAERLGLVLYAEDFDLT